MAKKNNKEKAYRDEDYSQADIDETKKYLQQTTSNGIRYLDRVGDEMISDPNYIPDHVQKVLYPWIRKKRGEFDFLTEGMESVDKNSDEHTAFMLEREAIARGFVMAKSQISDLNTNTGNIKKLMQNMNEGTREEDLYTNMLIYGAQADGVAFDEFGKLHFFAKPLGSRRASKKEDKIDPVVFKLDDITASSSIVTEPYLTKTFVWNMAEQTKLDADAGKSFDYNWTEKRITNNLTEGGPQSIIGTAFTDLAGDGESKSFAKMYEEGLKDQSYYIHPETGETLPKSSAWMKNPNNTHILKKFLSRYITNIMKDIYGPRIDEKTGLTINTPSQLAQKLIKKYGS